MGMRGQRDILASDNLNVLIRGAGVARISRRGRGYCVVSLSAAWLRGVGCAAVGGGGGGRRCRLIHSSAPTAILIVKAQYVIVIELVVVCLTSCAMPREQYVDLLTRADSAMSVHQDRLQREYQLGAWPRFDYDEGTGILVFSQAGVAKVLADIQFVGEVSRRDSVWTWAWQLPYVKPTLARAASTSRRYGWFHGIAPLRESPWHGDGVDGWEMTALTGWLAGAEGGYRAPSSDSATYTFLLLRNVRWAPSGSRVESYILSARRGS